MPNTILTEATVSEHVNTLLGGDNVEVEITDALLRAAVRATVVKINRYLPLTGFKSLPLISGTTRYNLPEIPGFIGVCNVSFLPATVANRSNVDYALDPFSRYDTNTYMDVGSVAQRSSYMQSILAANGDTPSWEYVEENGQPVLLITAPPNYLCSYSYTYDITEEYVPVSGSPDGYGERGLKLIRQTEVDWFLDYVTNRVKFAIGTALRKFGGIPNPEGGVSTLHGDQLVSEATAEEATLIEEIKSRRALIPPDFGG